MTNNQSEIENENTAGGEQVISENPVDVGGPAEMAALMKEMQKQMRILQEKVDNGRTLSGPCTGEVRPPLSGPHTGDEREENGSPGSRENESARSERNVAKADENMAVPSENGVDDLTKDMNDFIDENGGEGEEEEEEDKGSDELNDEWVNEVAEMFDEPDENGPNMSESLANLVTKILSKRLKADKEEEITSDLKRPGNVPILSNPRVEEEIWKKNDSQNSEARVRIETCWGCHDEMVDKERKRLSGGETFWTDAKIKREGKGRSKGGCQRCTELFSSWGHDF